MSTVTRDFHVDVGPDLVVPYLADFSHAVDWDPGTVSCEQTSDGPVQVGTTWHNTSKLAGISTELTYTLEQLTEAQVVFVGRNDTATSTETIDVVRAGAGSHITYANELHFHGAAKLATPLARLLFEKVGNDMQTQLTETLNALVR